MNSFTDTLNFFSKLTFRRLFNLLLVHLSASIAFTTKKPYHFGMPFSLAIEPTTACNLHCPECPTGQNQLMRPKGNIDLDLYKKIIDENSKHLLYLILYFQGEPLLNKEFTRLVSYAESKNIYTSTSTNANLLTDENARALIQSGLDRIIISFDGMDQETYSTYRVGGQIDKVMNGIKLLVKWRKQLNISKPYIILQTLALRSNEHQLNQIKKFAKENDIDKIEFKSAQFYDYKKGNPLLPLHSKYSRYKKLSDGTYTIKKTQRNRCFKMWSSSVITWDGKVIPCCFDKDAGYTMGDIRHDTFQHIWQNENYNNFRKSILKNRKALPICCNCTE